MIQADKALLRRLKDVPLCNLTDCEFAVLKVLLRIERYEEEHRIFYNDIDLESIPA